MPNREVKIFDVIILGAGASGLMSAIEAGKRGRKVLILDHARKPGNKIRMAGGGKCNFTNYDVSDGNYISGNRHFVKSALSRFTQWDFLDMVQQHKVEYEERDHGQLFCKNSSKDILNMLLSECDKYNITLRMLCKIKFLQKKDGSFEVHSDDMTWSCTSLVVATGGLSIPTSGASPFAYRIAEQFGINVKPVRAGLVPLTLVPDDKKVWNDLSGIAVDAELSCNNMVFRENILITHRGFSGPVILQISNYWEPGREIYINWIPGHNLQVLIDDFLENNPAKITRKLLGEHLPHRLVNNLVDKTILDTKLKSLTKNQLHELTKAINQFSFVPAGTEGYKTAEVTCGGIDCDEISSKTFESSKVHGLYFIGEALDVTGWLGGYNLQWAWSSGYCAGQYI